MEENFEVIASPRFINVQCPKHRDRMQELSNGIMGKRLWYCKECDRPYFLQLKMMKEDQFDRVELNKQIATQNNLNI